MEQQPLLRMEKISKRFPGVQALDDVDFEVYPGEILGFRGRERRGQIHARQDPLGSLSQGPGQRSGSRASLSRSAARTRPKTLGITTIYQELALVPHLSVAENIFLNREPRRVRQIGLVDFKAQKQAGRGDHGRPGSRDPRRQAGEGPDGGRPADGRDRQGRLAQCQPDPDGRADVGPFQQGSGRAVRPDAPARRKRACRWSSSATGWKRCCRWSTASS